MKKSEFIKRAWSFIDAPRKWIAGEEKCGNTYCSVGALKAAYRALIAEGVPEAEAMPLYIEVSQALSLDVRTSIIDYNDSHSYGTVARWWTRVADKLSKAEAKVEVKVELQPQPTFLAPQQPKVVHVQAQEAKATEKQREMA